MVHQESHIFPKVILFTYKTKINISITSPIKIVFLSSQVLVNILLTRKGNKCSTLSFLLTVAYEHKSVHYNDGTYFYNTAAEHPLSSV